MEIRKNKGKRQAMLDICAIRDIQNEYDLNGNVTEINCNFHGEEKAEIKSEDWIVAFIFVAIIFANIICTSIHLKAITGNLSMYVFNIYIRLQLYLTK